MAFGYTFLNNGRDFCNLLVCGVVLFVTAMVYSLQGPIYPLEAARKGASATEFGLVLGGCELVLLVLCPVASWLVLAVGPWRVFNVSAIIIGTATASFGLLGFIEGTALFVGMSFLLRFLEGVGSAGVHMGTYSLLTREFPGHTSETFGIVEMAFGIGLSVGPVLGTALYSIDFSNINFKFMLPFVVLGSLHFVSALVFNCVLRSGRSSCRRDSDLDLTNETKPLGFLQLLRMPAISYFVTLIVVATFNYGFQTALLSTYLNETGLSSIEIGAMYLGYGILYTISSPLCSKYANKMKEPIHLTLVGALVFLLVFSFFAISATEVLVVPLSVIAATLMGFAHGSVLLTAYVLCMREAESRGYDDAASLSAQVSALWISSYSLGGFLGPSVAGFVFDHTNFFSTALIFLGANVILVLSIPIYLMVKRRPSSYVQISERTGLIIK